MSVYAVEALDLRILQQVFVTTPVRKGNPRLAARRGRAQLPDMATPLTAPYRVYKANFSFSAREGSELSIGEGDTVLVSLKPSGEWPDAGKWMKGQNTRTGEFGDFPGTYCEFVSEVAAAAAPDPRPPERTPRSPPPAQDVGNAPPVPPRRPKMSARK